MNQHTITVPFLFFDDHEARDCVTFSGTPSQYTVKVMGKRIKVTLAVEDIADLVNDAHYYADSGDEGDEGLRRLIRSARNTLTALEKQGFSVDWMWEQLRAMDAGTR